jgi:hypothetical protein
MAEKSVRQDEAHYLALVRRMIETGSLSERIRAALQPYAGDAERLRDATRRVYAELADCLEENEPWAGRGFEASR